MHVRDLFSERDLETVTAAVGAAEERTGGELACVVVGRCDDYDGALWRGATLGALAGAVAAVLWRTWVESWGGQALWLGLPPLAGAAAGYLLVAASDPLRRLLAGAEALAGHVKRRAAAAFLEQEVFATRDRTGVLLFLAIFERRVEVVCDSGIRARVPEEDWGRIAGELAAGIRRGEPTAALLAAVEACGRLLEEHGVARRSDDRDELANAPRLYDE